MSDANIRCAVAPLQELSVRKFPNLSLCHVGTLSNHRRTRPGGLKCHKCLICRSPLTESIGVFRTSQTQNFHILYMSSMKFAYAPMFVLLEGNRAFKSCLSDNSRGRFEQINE